MKNYQAGNPISQWDEEDRPREKLELKGKSVLSNAELIALLIGSGTKSLSAVGLAREILQKNHENLIELGRLGIADLCQFKGIGKAKAITIIAALELGRRRRAADALIKPKITCSQDAYEIFQSVVSDSNYEEFWILMLNRANRIIQKEMISQGGAAGTVADPKKIFKKALEKSAHHIILCHNHPSGNLQPSESDIRLTNKLCKAGNHLDLPVIDHLIISEQGYFSFADEGMLNGESDT